MNKTMSYIYEGLESAAMFSISDAAFYCAFIDSGSQV